MNQTQGTKQGKLSVGAKSWFWTEDFGSVDDGMTYITQDNRYNKARNGHVVYAPGPEEATRVATRPLMSRLETNVKY